VRARRSNLWAALVAVLFVLACGETRRSIGDECLRDEDCLSGSCSARACVAAPTLVTGANGEEPDEEPQITGPEGDAGDGG
jgi:hypothetical protein